MRWLALAAALLLSPVALKAQPADQTFDDLASGATLLPTASAARELLWPVRGSCRGASGSFARVQCEALRLRVKGQVSSSVYRLDLPGIARLGPFSKKKRSAVMRVYGCLDCATDKKLVVGKGALASDAATVMGPVLRSQTVVFKDQRTFQARAQVAARARTELLFRVGNPGAGALTRFELVGFRSYDPCDGSIVMADPPSEERSPNAKFCPERKK